MLVLEILRTRSARYRLGYKGEDKSFERAIRPECVFPSLPPLRKECGPLAAGYGPYDQKRLGPRRDRVGQRGVRQFMGQILLAGEEPYERSALLRDVVADRPAQHGVAGLERVEDRALRGLSLDVKLHLAVHLRQCLQVCREHDSDQIRIRQIISF